MIHPKQKNDRSVRSRRFLFSNHRRRYEKENSDIPVSHRSIRIPICTKQNANSTVCFADLGKLNYFMVV